MATNDVTRDGDNRERPGAHLAGPSPERSVMTPIVERLAERARWYRDGCDGLDDRDSYFLSGDCARDAASDLEEALSEIRVLERVIALAREARTRMT